MVVITTHFPIPRLRRHRQSFHQKPSSSRKYGTKKQNNQSIGQQQLLLNHVSFLSLSVLNFQANLHCKNHNSIIICQCLTGTFNYYSPQLHSTFQNTNVSIIEINCHSVCTDILFRHKIIAKVYFNDFENSSIDVLYLDEASRSIDGKVTDAFGTVTIPHE